MLNVPNPSPSSFLTASAKERQSFQLINVDYLLAAARRQIWIGLLCGFLGLALGVAYIVTAVPLFTASIDMLIDKSRSQVIDQLTAAASPLQDESETLSQVEILKSEQLARIVIERLRLVDNRAFMQGNPSIVAVGIEMARSWVDELARLVSGTGLTVQDAEALNERTVDRAVEILQTNTSVSRVGRTYVLRLSYENSDAALAAAIAAAFGNAYLEDQLQSKFDASARAGEWLQDRIGELKQQAFKADINVQKFRTDNNLIAAGGQLVSEQQLSEINTQLIASQAATAEARARLQQIEGLIAVGQTDAVVNDALVSTTINSLRERYLNTTRTRTEIEAKLGPEHIQVKRLDAELIELERLIFSELRRIAESYRSTYNVALSREQSLRKSLSDILSVTATANTTQVQLRELEREAETFKTLYESFLSRYQETVQQQTFPISDARVITPATEPRKASSPKKTVSLAVFLALGLATGGALSAFREYRDRFFRTADQVRDELGEEFLGFIPIAGTIQANERLTNGSSLWKPDSIAVHVRAKPLSAFAETLRNIKVAADMALPAPGCKVIGVVSCLPSEGKSTVSANLANMIAMQGARVALVDGDMRNPGLTRGLQVRPQTGLIEVLTAATPNAELPLLKDFDGRFSLLPTVLRRRVSHTSELLASPQMEGVVNCLKQENEYVIIDLPPTGPVVDAKAFAGRLDAILFVVEWGRTSRKLVRSTLENTPIFRDRCLGVVLNKSDETRMKFYRTFGSEEYYARRYRSYYVS